MPAARFVRYDAPMVGRGAAPKSLPEAELERVGAERLALLARKFDGAASAEDAARIRVLTERLRRLAPRVTEADHRGAAEMVFEVEEVDARLARIRQKYGLR